MYVRVPVCSKRTLNIEKRIYTRINFLTVEIASMFIFVSTKLSTCIRSLYIYIHRSDVLEFVTKIKMYKGRVLLQPYVTRYVHFYPRPKYATYFVRYVLYLFWSSFVLRILPERVINTRPEKSPNVSCIRICRRSLKKTNGYGFYGVVE